MASGKSSSLFGGGNGDESYFATFSIGWILSMVILGFFSAGATFGVYVFVKNYDNDFVLLSNTDVRLQQAIYKDSQARELKDILLEQQNAELAAEIPPETAERLANYLLLLSLIQNETDTRIWEQQYLTDLLNNETAARVAADLLLYPQIVNITMMVQMAEQYNIYSRAKFMILMNNITSLDQRLTVEIDTRTAAYRLLEITGAQHQSTIDYLFSKLAKETHDRTIKDELLQEQLNFIMSMTDGLKSINGVGPTDSRVKFTSPNPVTTFGNGGNPKGGNLIIFNNGIYSINGVTREPTTKDIAFIAGERMTITQTGLHELTIATDLLPTAMNIVHLSGTYALSYVTPDQSMFGSCTDFNNTIIPCGPAAKKAWLPVLPPNDCSQRGFPLYNGNTCGWSAPSNGTFIVEIVVTLSVTLNYPYGNKLTTFSLAIPEVGVSDAICTIAYPETGGCMKVVDTVTVGGSIWYFDPPTGQAVLTNFVYWPKFELEVVLKSTEIIYVPTQGTDTSGCFNGLKTTCGALINPMFNADYQTVGVLSATVQYTASKIAETV